VVDLEHVQHTFRIWVPVSKRVKPSAQDDVLAYPPSKAKGKFVLGVSTACGRESPQVRRQGRSLRFLWISLQDRSTFFPDYAKCDRIIENLGII
jgi:hypothetical protein